MKKSMGFILLMTAIFLMLGVEGTIETLPPYAGVPEWTVLGLFTLLATTIGLLGVSYIMENNNG
jgi:hypothetical protein